AISAGYMFNAGTVNLCYNHWQNENNYILPTGGPIGLGLSNRIAAAKGFFQAGGLIIKPKFTYQRNERMATAPGLSREFLPDSARVDLELDVYTLRLDMEHRDTGRFSGTIGAEIRYYEHENLGLVPLQPTGHYTNASAYIFEEIDLGSYSANAGLRLDYRNQKFFSSESNPLLPADETNDYFNLASALGASFPLGDNLTLVGNINQGFRIPSFFNSYVYGLHGGVFAFQIGNPDLEPELSFDLSSGLRLSMPGVDASVTGYFDYIRNYIYLYDAPGHPLAPPPAEYEFVFAHEQDEARIIGLDLHAGLKPLDWLQLSGNFSIIDSEFLGGPHQGRALPLMPASKADATVRFILPDAGTLRNSNIRIKLRYSAEKESAGIYEPFGQFDDGIGPDIPFGVASTESYLLLDAGAGFDLDFGDTELKIDIEANNLTDESYRDFLDTYKGYLLGPGRGFSVTVNIPFWYR
ncbi:MAG: TonB-dependent receptor, partial [Candidatus Latescibacteria bacterium]|nr:TonB-dependent receptor [bacterium]MBD3425343.1 TonB-dependent receptor [Candidatus Latescibacterota bacterium]